VAELRHHHRLGQVLRPAHFEQLFTSIVLARYRYRSDRWDEDLVSSTLCHFLRAWQPSKSPCTVAPRPPAQLLAPCFASWFQRSPQNMPAPSFAGHLLRFGASWFSQGLRRGRQHLRTCRFSGGSTPDPLHDFGPTMQTRSQAARQLTPDTENSPCFSPTYAPPALFKFHLKPNPLTSQTAQTHANHSQPDENRPTTATSPAPSTPSRRPRGSGRPRRRSSIAAANDPAVASLAAGVDAMDLDDDVEVVGNAMEVDG
jgi:hypothetical protein